MSDQTTPPPAYRTDANADGVWFSLAPALIPPDETAAWVDLHRHQAGGMIVLGRFAGPAAAITHAWRHLGVAPEGWRPDPEAI